MIYQRYGAYGVKFIDVGQEGPLNCMCVDDLADSAELLITKFFIDVDEFSGISEIKIISGSDG
ncbi:hypothetical protein GCM10028827_37340 [Mucilaginibacter myungsuensis]